MYQCNCNLFSSKMNVTVVLGIVVLLHLVSVVPRCVCSQQQRLFVKRTLVQNTSATDALCLDGSLPAYHLHRGFGAGQNNWLLQFEGGGWCNDLKSCLNRSTTRLGSTRYDKSKLDIFAGILSNDSSLNPDFYDWNRVRLRYCDGASFTGDAVFDNGTTKLYFKGQKIWEAIIQDLLPKGLGKAHQALLSGCSAGGLATFHHCDNFAEHLPSNANVKCLSDAGFFLDGRDISSKYTARNFFKGVVELQGVKQNLNRNCTRALSDPDLCFIPQYVLKYIATPYFILNSAYDVYQFNNILVPPSADINGVWKECKKGLVACTPDEINILQGFRRYMLETLKPFLINSESGGMFINSCFAHCQGDVQDTWFGNDSPRLNNKTIAEAVGDWYFGRNRSKEIDCAYPCDKTCHNLIPKKPPQVTAKPSSQQKGGRDFFLHSYTSEH